MQFIGAKSWVFHPRTRGRRVIFSMLVEQRNKQSSYKSTTWLDDFKTGEYSDVCTFEAATSCAVLAAISCEQAMSSSYVPFSPTTRSAESLTATEENDHFMVWYSGWINDAQCVFVLILTAAVWRPSPQLWRRRWVLRSNESFWHKIL